MNALREQKGFSIIRSISTVLRKPPYAIIAIAATLLFLLVASWLPNRALLRYILGSGAFSLADKLSFLFSLKGLTINATKLSLSLLISTAILFGINIALLSYYLKKRASLERAAGASTLGILGSLMGVGCASCGSVILASLFGFAASATVTGALPFKGLEFSAAGLFLVAFSTYFVARKIARPLVC